MDSFKNFQNIIAKKSQAMERYQRIQKVIAFFKLIELFIFLIVLSRFTTLFQISFKLSGEHIKEFFVNLISPRFVFIIGNLIVFTLFWKSGQLSNQDSSNKNNGKLDFYDEYVSCHGNKKDEFEEKQSIEKQRNGQISSDVVVCREVVIAEKKMQRSQSERLRNTHELKAEDEKSCNGLRRSKTTKCFKMKNNEVVAVHQMSNEDFRLRVESFITRQQRFLREDDE